MALGKTHDKINWVVGSLFTGSLVAFNVKLIFCFCYLIGWLFSTWFFSPDTDQRPKKRSGVLQFFLYPYSIISKHRGLSHSLLWGTIYRIVYGLAVVAVFIYVLNQMGHIETTLKDYLSFLMHFITHFSLSDEASLITLWFFFGLFMADATHIVIDRFSSQLKRIF